MKEHDHITNERAHMERHSDVPCPHMYLVAIIANVIIAGLFVAAVGAAVIAGVRYLP